MTTHVRTHKQFQWAFNARPRESKATTKTIQDIGEMCVCIYNWHLNQNRETKSIEAANSKVAKKNWEKDLFGPIGGISVGSISRIPNL